MVGHREILMCWICGGNSREFLKFSREFRGIYRRIIIFFLIFVADYDIFSFQFNARHAYRAYLNLSGSINFLPIYSRWPINDLTVQAKKTKKTWLMSLTVLPNL